MSCLYVTSLEEGVGRTLVCAGLARHLLEKGRKVGFFKPIIATGEQRLTRSDDRDTLFMKQILDLEEPVGSLCPVIGDEDDVAAKIKEAYTRTFEGKDVIVTDGPYDQNIIQALDAEVLAIESYSDELSGVKALEPYQNRGEHLLGIVLNKVPGHKLERVRDAAIQLVGSRSNVLGVIPEDRVLFALTIAELSDHIQGEILNSREQSSELIENIMIGAMTVDPAPEYYGRKNNKAVVLRSDHPDMQIAALETSTRCLVLCGDRPPMPAILDAAENKNMPIVQTKADIKTTVSSIEDALNSSRFNQVRKLPRVDELIGQNFDFQPLYKGLGLAG